MEEKGKEQKNKEKKDTDQRGEKTISQGSACGCKNHEKDGQQKELEIDLVELARCLWVERKFLLKILGAATVVALIIAFSLPKEYTTVVKFIPEIEDASKKMNNLGGLAAMAGINLNTSTGSDAISPDLYPDVVRSIPFLLELFPVEVNYKEGYDSISLYEYMTKFQKKAWWTYPLGMPSQLISWFQKLSSKENEKNKEGIDLFHLTPEQKGVVEALRQRIQVSIDKKTFAITLSVQMQNAQISAQFTQLVLEKLQIYITAYRTRKVKNDLEFTQKIYTEARDAYYEAQRMYASFEDSNRNIVSASYRTEQERLKNEMTLTFNVYNTLAQKLEQDKLRVQEQTPVYTVIEPPTVPLGASSPKKVLILIGIMFLGLFGGIAYLLIRNLWKRNVCPVEPLQPEV